MLLNLREYHRPADEGGGLKRVLDLLARPTIRTVALAGADTLLASADPSIEAVVDLQGLGLNVILGQRGGRLQIGSLATRAQLAEDEGARSHYAGILAEAARRWGGSVQRNRATIGGALAIAAANDPLVVALLACDALVNLESHRGSRSVPIADFLAQRAALLAAPAIITEVIVPHPNAGTGAALATVARTPSDAPIVVTAAVLVVRAGLCQSARLALGGVAEAPVPLPAVAAMLAGQPLTETTIAAASERAAAGVQPVGDFRGSAAYRKAMAGVLTERALRQAWERSA